MANSQILASALLIVHLVSVTTAAIVREPRGPQAADTEEAPVGPLAVMLAPRVNAIAEGIQVANDALWRHSAGLRLLTDGYVRVFALHQRWRMFASPSRSEQYVRVSFAIAPTGGSPPERLRVVHWLVYPTWRPDRVRGLGAFRDSYRDKSLERVIAGFTDRNGPQLLNALNQRRKLGPADTSDLQRQVNMAGRDFEPVIRYYIRQYRRHLHQAAESIDRTEVWYGEATIAPPEETAALDRETRNKTLAPQFDGPVTMFRTEEPGLGTQERQAGIVWTLYHIGVP